MVIIGSKHTLCSLILDININIEYIYICIIKYIDIARLKKRYRYSLYHLVMYMRMGGIEGRL